MEAFATHPCKEIGEFRIQDVGIMGRGGFVYMWVSVAEEVPLLLLRANKQGSCALTHTRRYDIPYDVCVFRGVSFVRSLHCSIPPLLPNVLFEFI